MSDTQITVPSRLDLELPPAPATPRKARSGKWLIVGAAATVILATGIGTTVAVTAGVDTTPVVDTPAVVEPAPAIPAPVEPVVPSQSELEAQAASESLPYLKDARSDLGVVDNAQGLPAMAGGLDRVGDDLEMAALPWQGIDDGVYMHLTSAADHFHNEATAVRNLDVAGVKYEQAAALRDLKAANRAINAADYSGTSA